MSRTAGLILICGSFLIDSKQPSILDTLSKASTKAKPVKKATALKITSSDSDGAPTAVVQKKPAQKRKTDLSSDQSDSDSDSGNLMARLKGKSSAGKVV